MEGRGRVETWALPADAVERLEASLESVGQLDAN
jgi:hypothetical protein